MTLQNITSGTSVKVNGTVSKQIRPINAETDCDVVHCPTMGDKHRMFDPQLADVVNPFAHVLIWHTRDSILTNIDYMCWAGKNGRAMIFLTNL